MRILLLSLVLLTACSHRPPEAPIAPSVLASWTELGENGILIARAVVEGPCPSLAADGTLLAMSERAPPSDAYPRVCEAKVDRSVKSLSLGTIALPVVPAEIKHIAEVGDTGCRLKVGKNNGKLVIQACRDPAQWPFAAIARQVAQTKPDLVIHVGDYHYRETACPPDHPECAGSPHGENWGSWSTDFFNPASPLLAAAPWVFVRGNHESCDRAGDGWFRFLDPRPFPGTCRKRTDPYRVLLPGFALAVVDSADLGATQASLAALAAQPAGDDPEWLLLHRPFLAPSPEEAKQTVVWTEDLRRRYSFVLAGHIHTFAANRFRDSRPPEVISGNGGALLDRGPFPFEKNPQIKGVLYREFGYLTIDRDRPGTWSLVSHDVAGQAKAHCRLHEKPGRGARLHCDRQ